MGRTATSCGYGALYQQLIVTWPITTRSGVMRSERTRSSFLRMVDVDAAHMSCACLCESAKWRSSSDVIAGGSVMSMSTCGALIDEPHSSAWINE